MPTVQRHDGRDRRVPGPVVLAGLLTLQPPALALGAPVMVDAGVIYEQPALRHQRRDQRVDPAGDRARGVSCSDKYAQNVPGGRDQTVAG